MVKGETHGLLHTHHFDSSEKRPSAARGMMGAGMAGFLELFLFHPLDTAAKRLINHRGWESGKRDVAKVIFKDASDKGFGAKLLSLYKAFGYAVGYKMLQRSLQFGSHPMINHHLKKYYLPKFEEAFGDRMAKTIISGVSGMVIGTLEVVLLPLDALKVKRQTGVEFLSKKTSNQSTLNPLSKKTVRTSGMPLVQQNSMSTLAWNNGTSYFHLVQSLYRGATWTAARNSVGLFALFGSSTFVKDNIFHLSDKGAPKATVGQLFTASLAGALMSIAVAAPFDVIKVRMQATSLDSVGRVKGFEILKTLLRTEGMWALTKGCVPKMIASGPKVAFSFTVAQWLTEYLSRT